MSIPTTEITNLQENLLDTFGLTYDTGNPMPSVDKALRGLIDMLNYDKAEGEAKIAFNGEFTPALAKRLAREIDIYRAGGRIKTMVEALANVPESGELNPLQGLTKSTIQNELLKKRREGAPIPNETIRDPHRLARLFNNAESVLGALSSVYAENRQQSFAPVERNMTPIPSSDDQQTQNFTPMNPVEVTAMLNDKGVQPDNDSPSVGGAGTPAESVVSVDEPVEIQVVTSENAVQHVVAALEELVPEINAEIKSQAGGWGAMLGDSPIIGGLLGNLFGPDEVKMPGNSIASVNESLQGALPLILEQLGIEVENPSVYTATLGWKIKNAYPHMLDRQLSDLSSQRPGFLNESDFKAVIAGNMTDDVRNDILSRAGSEREAYYAFEKSVKRYQKLKQMPIEVVIMSLNQMADDGDIMQTQLASDSGGGGMPGWLSAFVAPFKGIVMAFAGMIPGGETMVAKLFPEEKQKTMLADSGKEETSSSGNDEQLLAEAKPETQEVKSEQKIVQNASSPSGTQVAFKNVAGSESGQEEQEVALNQRQREIRQNAQEVTQVAQVDPKDLDVKVEPVSPSSQTT